jgi:peroxiredoxin
VVVVGVLVAVAAWSGVVVLARRTVSPAESLRVLIPGAIVTRADDLSNAVPGDRPFEAWTASTEESGTSGTLYRTTIANPLASGGLSRFLLQPGSLSIGVTVDPSMTIQQVRILSPRKLVGATKSTGSYLDGWKGMSFFQVLTAAEGFEPPGGGALTGPIGALVRNLATSVYLRDMGQEGFDRFMAQVKSPGLRVGFPFPYFTAQTWSGAQFNLGQLAGKKVLVLFTQPTCGSCFEATMSLLDTVAARKFDITPVVFIAGDPQLDPVKRFAQEVPSGAILISDPSSELARSVHQTLTPYAVILGEDHIVRYSGGSDENSGVYQSLEQLAGAQ